MLCSTKDCLHDAAVTPTLLFWAIGHEKYSHPPLEGRMNVPVCLGCSQRMTIRNFVTLDDGRRMIAAMVRAVGKAEPDLDGGDLRWDPVETFPVPDVLPGLPVGRA